MQSVFLLALLAFLASTALVKPSQAAPAQNATKVDKEFAYIRGCASKLSLKCGNLTFYSVFDGKPKDIGTECCLQVHLMGYNCHKDMVQSIITEEHYNKERVPSIHKRSQALWNHCTVVSHRRIRYCENRLTMECGTSLFQYVFERRTKAVKPACCEQLMDMGRRCHKDMVESLLKSEDYKSQKKEIHERSKNLWKQCTTSK